MNERGATLTGYALSLALLVVMSLGSIKVLESSGETYLIETGSKIGEPRPTFDEMTYTGTGSGTPPSTTPTTTPTTPSPTANPQGTVTNAPLAFGPQVNAFGTYPTNNNLNCKKPCPYTSDSEVFVFGEGKIELTSPWVVPGTNPEVILDAGDAVCVYYLHFSPNTTKATIQNVEVNFNGTVLSVIGDNKGLDETDGWSGGTTPTANYQYNRELDNKETPSINDTSISFNRLRDNLGRQDNARIFVEC